MEDKNKLGTSNTASSSSSSEKKRRHKHRNNHSKVVTSTPVNEGPYRPNISSVTRVRPYIRLYFENHYTKFAVVVLHEFTCTHCVINYYY
uniref:Uncharacterized protein n=1 Tax=Trichobilharzia regenti TaxID=157069 RepID=A0AA85J6R0_TRIRE|nr:unnamed protein product [Trichobilharzia regenti]